MSLRVAMGRSVARFSLFIFYACARLRLRTGCYDCRTWALHHPILFLILYKDVVGLLIQAGLLLATGALIWVGTKQAKAADAQAKAAIEQVKAAQVQTVVAQAQAQTYRSGKWKQRGRNFASMSGSARHHERCVAVLIKAPTPPSLSGCSRKTLNAHF